VPRVSVILPTYNRAHTVQEAVDSILGQTYQDFEAIVVDDASTDDTDAVLAGYGDRVKVIRRATNGGAGTARNDGIKASTGELIAFLDSDDCYLPRRLESAVEALDAHPEYGAVYGNMVCVDVQGSRPDRLWITGARCGHSGWIFDAVLEHGLMTTQTTTVRRSILDRVGLFDESLRSVEDLDLWWRIARHAQVGYMGETVAVYRILPGSTSRLGARSSEYWVRLSRKAIDTYTDLTPRQRRVVMRRLCWDLRVHALHLGAAGRHQEARAACREAINLALENRLWALGLRATIASMLGYRGRHCVRAMRLAVDRIRYFRFRPASRSLVDEGDPGV